MNPGGPHDLAGVAREAAPIVDAMILRALEEAFTRARFGGGTRSLEEREAERVLWKSIHNIVRLLLDVSRALTLCEHPTLHRDAYDADGAGGHYTVEICEACGAVRREVWARAPGPRAKEFTEWARPAGVLALELARSGQIHPDAPAAAAAGDVAETVRP